MGLLEGVGQGSRRMRHHNQMHVIGHKTVTEQRKTIELRVLPQQFEIGDPIRILREDGLLGVTTLCNMVGNFNQAESRGQGGGGAQVTRTTLLDAAYADGVSRDRSHREQLAGARAGAS